MSIGKKRKGGISSRQAGFSKYQKTSDRIRQAQGNTVNHYTEDWNSIKNTVKRINNYTCSCCGVQVLPEDAHLHDRVLMVDHKIPIAQGGQTILSNLCLLCDLCHSRKPGKANRRGASLVTAVANQVRTQRHAKRTKS